MSAIKNLDSRSTRILILVDPNNRHRMSDLHQLVDGSGHACPNTIKLIADHGLLSGSCPDPKRPGTSLNQSNLLKNKCQKALKNSTINAEILGQHSYSLCLLS